MGYRYSGAYHWLSLLVTGITLVTVVVLRFHLLEVPLERDEGEYAYSAQLILQGIPPFAGAYNMKMPGIYGVYACIMLLLGENVHAIHLGLLFINVMTIILTIVLVCRLFSARVGLMTSAIFSVLSLSPTVHGMFANAEHFVMPFSISGLILLLSACEQRSYMSALLTGILLGIAAIVKQHGAAFVLLGFVWSLLCPGTNTNGKITIFSRIRFAGTFSIGSIIPFVIICLIIWRAGTFDKFWFWTFDYARSYTSMNSLSQGFLNFKYSFKPIFRSTALILFLCTLGGIFLIKSDVQKRVKYFSVCFLCASFLAIIPGFYFREHYYILLLPALSLFAAIGLDSLYALMLKTGSKEHRALVILNIALVAALLQPMLTSWETLFRATPDEVSRSIYGLNPFVESPHVARYIKRHTNPDAKLAIIGSEPQIYFYAQRRAATKYIYTYALMEDHPYATKMQNEMISEIEMASPEFIVFVNIKTSWLERSSSNMMIFSWFNKYIEANYKLTGLVDIINKEHTTYVWGKEAPNYKPRSPFWLAIYRKET